MTISTSASTNASVTDTPLLTAAWPAVSSEGRIPDGSQANGELATSRSSGSRYLDEEGVTTSTLSSDSRSVVSRGSSGESLSSSAEWVARFQNWSQLGEAQAKISDTQASEAALLQTYRQLQLVNGQLSQQGAQADALAQQLRSLEQSVRQDGSLTEQLQPTVLSSTDESTTYLLDKVDLLSAKPSSEQLRIYFPSSRSGVSVSLPASSSGQQVVDALNQALQREGVQASLTERGQLGFTATSDNERKLSEPLLMTGQGIRVPAGNAVSVRLTAVQGTLDALADQTANASDTTERQTVQQEIRQLQQQIQSTLQQLRAYRQELLRETQYSAAVAGFSGSGDASAASQALQQLLGQGDYQVVVTGLQAQANLSSQTVVALLS